MSDSLEELHLMNFEEKLLDEDSKILSVDVSTLGLIKIVFDDGDDFELTAEMTNGIPYIKVEHYETFDDEELIDEV